MRAARSALASIATAVSAAPLAHASFLDTDFYCRVYGCVIVHDGVSFDVYDNYIFATGGTVPSGSRMIPWSGNPVEGTGAVNPVFTGTRTEGFHTPPASNQGVLLGFDHDGDDLIDVGVADSGSGFLDAADVLQATSITQNSRLRTLGTSIQRSFYLSSRTDFYLSAQVFVTGGENELAAPATLSSVVFDYGLTVRGNDAGMAFGSNATNGNYRRLGAYSDFGGLFGGPQFIAEFRRSIRRRAADELPDQSIRFDYVYGFEDYDLSMGVGELQYRIEFDFYNR
ncbi:MAG: hypothetical protein AAFX03_00730 [Pseudomonadota bacterium]